MSERIGFIGLGNMGRGMAGQLVAKGFDTTVFDLAEAPMEILRQKGAKRAEHAQHGRPPRGRPVGQRVQEQAEQVGKVGVGRHGEAGGFHDLAQGRDSGGAPLAAGAAHGDRVYDQG
jgi:hypothetical protein